MMSNECKGKNRQLENCDSPVIEGTRFCENHQYMKDYTDEMLNNLKICSGCSNSDYLNNLKTCARCLKRGKDHREKAKENKIFCKFIKKGGKQCDYEDSGNGFCGKHKTYYFKEQTEKKGKKVCTDFIRGCRNELELDCKFSKCEPCRKRARDYEKSKLNKNSANDVDPNDPNDDFDDPDNDIIHEKYCSGCRQICKIKGKFSTCAECRAKTEIKNEEAKAERAKKPKCIYPKCINSQTCGEFCSSGHDIYNDPEKWKYVEKGNNGQICPACTNNRTKDAFVTNGKTYKHCILCRNTMKSTDLKRKSRKERSTMKDTIREIRRCALRRGIIFDINDDYITEMLSKHCAYCNDNATGLDRIDNNNGYVIDNINPACKICNFIKYTYEIGQFLQYCLNIYNNIGTTTKNTEPVIYGTYKEFLSQLKYRKCIENYLTEEERAEKLTHKCFYCANNNSNSLGLDRIDSLGNYTIENTVSCCYICNIMKKDYDINFFFDHIKKILYHNKLIDNLDKEFKFDTSNNNNSNISSTFITEELLKLIDKFHGKINANDHRNIKNFTHDESYYYSKIYNTYDISKFEPELEFCENDDQHDIWEYFRLRISSELYNKPKDGITCIYILIRDKMTKKYVGITSISNDFLFCENLDDYIGWKKGDKINNKKLNNIMNISTCIGIPPFSYNFNVGKLCAKLMFSREVYDYVRKCGDNLVGLVTYSLYGKSIQYDRLKELKFVGLTETENESMHIDGKLYNIISKYMEQNKLGQNKEFKSKMAKIKYLCNHLGIRDITFHGLQKGVYFGYLGSNGKDFLNCITNNFVPDGIKAIKEISDEWKNRWANQRFNYLIANKKIMIDYSFQNYTNNKEYNNYRVRKHLNKIDEKNKDKKNNDKKDKKYTVLSDDDKKSILKIWHENKDKSYEKLAKIVSEKLLKKISRKAIARIVDI